MSYVNRNSSPRSLPLAFGVKLFLLISLAEGTGAQSNLALTFIYYQWNRALLFLAYLSLNGLISPLELPVLFQ